ncbi:MAG: hypothetical protein NC489_33385 [Ruminococcus flavefaciens]|nr:hypothetical protein [Ruminococcus flavefaciens]
MGAEIKDELKKLMNKEDFGKLSDGEIEGVNEVRKLIEKKENANLSIFSIRDEILCVIYKDCKSMKQTTNRKNFQTDYEKLYESNIKRNGTNLELAKVAFGKMYANKFKYDYDAALISNYIFMKIYEKEYNFQVIEKIKEDNYTYMICNEEMVYRGDVMNSWSRTMNEYMRLFGDEYIKNYNGKKIPEGYKSWESYLRKPENYKDAMPEYINNFMKCVYTIGNFIPVPREPINFNTNRSGFSGDYWDLTLLAIYEYYIGQKEYPSIVYFLLGKGIEQWLGESGVGREGWNKFVENNFMQPFVEKLGEKKYGKPYELWDGHFNGSQLPKEKWQFEQFFVNARIRILQRGELIAKALVSK